MGREPGWVEENILWFYNRLDIKEDAYPKVWLIVQAYDDSEIISGEEFETVLNGSLSGKPNGLMMFTSYAVAEDSMKSEVMKKVYGDVLNSLSN